MAYSTMNYDKTGLSTRKRVVPGERRKHSQSQALTHGSVYILHIYMCVWKVISWLRTRGRESWHEVCACVCTHVYVCPSILLSHFVAIFTTKPRSVHCQYFSRFRGHRWRYPVNLVMHIDTIRSTQLYHNYSYYSHYPIIT